MQTIIESLKFRLWILSILILLVEGALSGGCSTKHTVKVDTPPNILPAKTASFDELRQLMASFDKIHGLSSNDLHLTMTSGRKESGRLERYHKVSGYLLLERPNAARLVITSPVMSKTIFDLVSIGESFRAWIPSRNKFYMRENNTGRGDIFEEDLPIPNAAHFFENIFPQAIDLDSPGIEVSIREEIDAGKKYYVLSTFKISSGTRLYPLRAIWFDRSNMTIARQQEYREDGLLLADIHYSEQTEIGGYFLPLKIHIDRPLDEYAFDMEIKTWRLNPNSPKNAFNLTPPPRAEIVHLGKWKRDNSLLRLPALPTFEKTFTSNLSDILR